MAAVKRDFFLSALKLLLRLKLDPKTARFMFVFYEIECFFKTDSVSAYKRSEKNVKAVTSIHVTNTFA